MSEKGASAEMTDRRNIRSKTNCNQPLLNLKRQENDVIRESLPSPLRAAQDPSRRIF